MKRDCGFRGDLRAKVANRVSDPAATPGASAPIREQAAPQLGMAVPGGAGVGQHCSHALGRSKRLALRVSTQDGSVAGRPVPVLQIAKRRFDFVPVFQRIQETMFSTATACRNAARINLSAIASMCTGSSSSAMPGRHSCGLARIPGAFRRICYAWFPAPLCTAMLFMILFTLSWLSRSSSAHRRPGWSVSHKDRF